MRVAPNTYLIASGVQGCSLTDDLDCNCWLFDAGGSYVLFDTGAGVDVDGIFEVMRQDGLEPSNLAHVFLTHAHGDHSGGAFEIKERSACQLWCGELTAELLAKGEDAISLGAARAAGVYPTNYMYNQPVPDAIFQTEVPLGIGNITITPIATPGHSFDHVSFLIEQSGPAALITGDAMFHSGRIIYQGTYDFDVRQSAESIRKLSTLAFDVLLPGHGIFVRRGGRRHVEAAVMHLDQLKTPRPIEFISI
jgi:glyoxylase-like metal-dependent hydrolase (beta-lactamase superfamily II)